MNNTIIIADDDDDFVAEVEENLSLEGYTIHRAKDGQEAVDLAIELVPDLIILDIVMPVLDGFQACKKIRENPSTSAISVILLTSGALGPEKIRGLEIGADDFVSKPIEWNEFKARVASVIRRSIQLRDISPLTNLPGNYRVSTELEKLVADQSNKYAVFNIEIDDFKSINDRYGSGRGDKVIKFTGDMLSRIMASTAGKPSVLGHIGGARFIIISAPENVDHICNEIISKFDAGIINYYDEEAQQLGYIELSNRKNEMIKHPICKISIGVVSTEWREVRSQWEATATATEMCEHAKRQEKSAFEVDRRTTDDQFLAMLDGKS